VLLPEDPGEEELARLREVAKRQEERAWEDLQAKRAAIKKEREEKEAKAKEKGVVA